MLPRASGSADLRLLVVGAESRLGRVVVEQALGHGHEVTALSLAPVGLSAARLREIRAERIDFDTLSEAVRGQQLVASLVGADGRPSRGGASGVAADLVHAMAVHEIAKLAAVSAAGAFRRGDANLPFAMRATISTVSRGRYDDFEAMEQRIKASGLTWTIVRPTTLSDGPATGAYRFTVDGSIPSKPKSISRADVAAALLKSVETSLWDRRVVTVSG